MKVRLIAALGAIALAGCGSDSAIVQAADQHEAVIPEMQRQAAKYGPDPRSAVIGARPGTGKLAGQAVTCGFYAGAELDPRVRDPRIIRIGQVNVIESAIGARAPVFAELWRRAGC